MKIGFDLTSLTNKPTGIGKYTYQVAVNMIRQRTEHEFVFFVSLDAPDFFDLPNNVKIVNLPAKKIPFWDRHIRDARIMMREKLDLVLFPANSAPLFYEGKYVLTIHDLAIYKHPEWFARQTGQAHGQWFATKVVVPRSIRKANHIIVPSENTKKDLMNLFKVGEDKIIVIPLAAERSPDVPGVPNLPDRKYILFVGTIEPRKNIARLIEAYVKLPQDLREKYDLVIVGKEGWGDVEDVKYQMSKVKGVHWLEYVDDYRLQTLYQKASVFVFPSLYEGFGLPVLEAMVAGVPTICSKQIAGNFYTTYSPDFPDIPFEQIDAYDIADISKKIEQVLCDEKLRQNMSQQGREFAKEFTWEKTASKTLKVFEEMNDSY